MSQIQSYRDLIVWQRSIELVKAIYDLTRQLPKDEQYVLVPQMRRAAISIPSNIAEGYRRKILGDYIRFLNIADASSAELETQLHIVQELYPNLDCTSCMALLNEIQRMLLVMLRKLRAKR